MLAFEVILRVSYGHTLQCSCNRHDMQTSPSFVLLKIARIKLLGGACVLPYKRARWLPRPSPSRKRAHFEMAEASKEALLGQHVQL